MSEEIIDADVVPGTDLEPRDHQAVSLFNTDDPVDVLEKATKVANALKRVVDDRGLIANIKGKEHPQVEAWQTLGSMLGVTAVCVRTESTTDRHGKPAYKATVEARYRGEVVGQADALCSTSEGRWKSADDYALLSMAQTRATSKALKGPLGWVMKLAGYESTPAEEMPHEAAQRSEGTSQYRTLLNAFKASGKTPQELADWLECDVSEINATVNGLTSVKARNLLGWLEGGS